MLFGDAYSWWRISRAPLFLSLGNQTVGKPLSRAMEFRDLKAGERRKEKSGATHAERRARSHFAITDPQPVSEVSRLWRTAAQSATIGMFIILLVVALELGASDPAAGSVGFRGHHDAGAAVGTGGTLS